MDRVEALHRTPGWMSEVRDLLEPIDAITIDTGIAEPADAGLNAPAQAVAFSTQSSLASLPACTGATGWSSPSGSRM